MIKHLSTYLIFGIKFFIFSILGIFFVSCSWFGGNELKPTISDNLLLIDNLDGEVLVKWGDPIGKEHFFGYNNHYISILEEEVATAKLWVSHDHLNTLLVSGFNYEAARIRNQINRELYNIGGSVIKVKKSGGSWQLEEDPRNIRVTGAQQATFDWHEGVQGRSAAFGMVGSSSGEQTPWGTMLIGENDYSLFYGDTKGTDAVFSPSKLRWERFYGHPTQHYGWVVEVSPVDASMHKQVNLGRFNHAGLATTYLPDGRMVIYMTDYQKSGCIYKYVAAQSDAIYPGELFVASVNQKRWNLISYDNSVLANLFPDETAMYIYCRAAALAIGGTPFEYPADLEVNPQTGEVTMAISGVPGQSNGSIIALSEQNNDPAATNFEIRDVLIGGIDNGFMAPYALTFDPKGNMWFSTNIKPELIGKPGYEAYGNNSLFVVMANEQDEQIVKRVAIAPMDASFSAPTFTKDFKSFFIGVQQPGILSAPGQLTSHWPDGGEEVPKSGIMVISGNFLDELNK